MKYAQPGMVLGLPVYNNYGKEILGRRTRLNEECLSIMSRNSISEILIEDQRVDDVVVASIVSPEKEGKLADAFCQLLISTRSTRSIDSSFISQVNMAVNETARNLILSIMGEINVACSVSEADYAYFHPVKSAMLAMALGFKLGMNTNELILLGMSSLLKDISSIFLPPGLLNKSPLTPEEQQLVREHPIKSRNLLSQFSEIKDDVTNIILQHHEQWNGKGYPRGLKGQQISRYAQIIAAADVFSDLLVEHPGKEKCMSHEAIEYLMACSGDQFDPDLVEAFVRKIPAYPNGLTVKLNTGEIGIVSEPNLGFIARPVIRICYDTEKGTLKKPYDINLAKPEFQRKLIIKVLEYE
jgi:HD-GYP domain-containing protein (c-di-GMP phosphodiesterase class II)